MTPPTAAVGIRIREADLSIPEDAAHYLELMDHFALDPMGGGAPLAPDVRARLVDAIRARSDVTLLFADPAEGPRSDAWEGPVCLAFLIESFSTHAARPLWNLHDMVVHASHRGRGIGTRMLEEIERLGRERGYCKITLEVLEENERAQAVYRGAGFDGYSPGSSGSGGAALFWQKKLDR